jgi:RNA polymerase sigma factor CnrH
MNGRSSTVCQEPDTLTTADRDALFSDNLPLADYLLGRLHLPGWVDPDDARQEALVGLWKAAEKFDPSRGLKFSALATACVRNQVLQHFDRAGRPLGQFPEEGWAEPADPRPGPAEAAELVETIARVRNGVQALPPRVGAAAELCWLKGLSREEAAAVMGVTKGCVSSQVHSAKKLLAEIIERGTG